MAKENKKKLKHILSTEIIATPMDGQMMNDDGLTEDGQFRFYQLC